MLPIPCAGEGWPSRQRHGVPDACSARLLTSPGFLQFSRRPTGQAARGDGGAHHVVDAENVIVTECGSGCGTPGRR